MSLKLNECNAMMIMVGTHSPLIQLLLIICFFILSSFAAFLPRLGLRLGSYLGVGFLVPLSHAISQCVLHVNLYILVGPICKPNIVKSAHDGFFANLCTPPPLGGLLFSRLFFLNAPLLF